MPKMGGAGRREMLLLGVAVVAVMVPIVHGQAYDPFKSRTAPEQWEMNDDDEPAYIVSPDRLDEIRSEKMYPFYDQGGNDGNGDFQLAIRDTQPQINKQLNFLLPFMGFGFNYTWLSLHGYLAFSEIPIQFPEYPLQFPIQQWPDHDDPSFIGIFYSRCKIGQLNGNEVEEYAKRRPGVYFRMERDLYTRKDQFGVEIRERAKWDIREGMVGTETFQPKHIAIATWKNVSFAGGIPSASRITNTMQMVLVTDEVRTYTIFNYDWMGWTTHTEAGGDTTEGQGGVPAFVGFNAGNGTRAYQYLPYSQTTYIRDLPGTGGANNFRGRHIFRIDEKILPGVCIRDLIGTNLPLTFAPENGHMLGGALVNLTGPCFEPGMRVTCRFNTRDVEGVVLNENRASCIQPWTRAEGWVDFSVSLNGGPFYWKGRFYVEPPSVSPELVWFTDDSYHGYAAQDMTLQWDPFNLTMNRDAGVSISLWGYREDSIEPELTFIYEIRSGETNDGFFDFNPSQFDDLDLGPDLRDYQMGMIKINLTNPEQEVFMEFSPAIWSRPMPLGWFFAEQWRRFRGNNWIEQQCDGWIQGDRLLKKFANELPMCPCLLRQAIADRGRYAPDFDCDQDGNTECFFHQGAQHCVVTGIPNHDGAGQQCCYDLAGYLMMTSDNKWGGNPLRYHNLGLLPWNEANKIPTMSHYLSDVLPFYSCCLWQDEQSTGCTTFRFERRGSQDCVGYQPPGGGAVFGDPHFYTFDGMPYTFNGKGEFVLVRSDSPKVKLDVQGRFEQVEDSPYGEVLGTTLTAVAAKDNTSATVEVRLRPYWAQWRYKLDVLVDQEFIYFDRYPQKIQHFPGVTVYTPSNILNQSHVVMMFQSGAGVEVLENKHYMAARVFLPWEFINQTRGLLGNWTFDIEDDFTLPDGTVGPVMDTSNIERTHKDFGMKWVVHDKEMPGVGKSLFTHSNGQSSNSYYDPYWEPEFEILPEIPENVTWTDEQIVEQTCGESYQCKFDYSVTLSREFAIFTKYYQDQFVNIREGVLKPEARVISCGALATPSNGRKSTFAFTPGTMVKFDCDPGYVLSGERRRWCYDTGDWNWAENGDATCTPVDQYNSQQAGITAAIVIAVLIPVGCCLVCLIIRLRQHAIEQRQMQMGAQAAGYNSVYKTTTGAYDDDSQRGGFFNRFQRSGGRQGYDSDSSEDKKYPIGAAAVHEGTIAQERETLQRDAAPMAYSRSFEPGTESSAPSTPESIKKIKQSRGSLNRNSVGMHPDPLLAMSQKSLTGTGSRPGSRSNLLTELGTVTTNSFAKKTDETLLGRTSTLPPPPTDLLSQSPKGATLASAPPSVSRPSTTSGTLKSALKSPPSSSSDDAGAAVMKAANAAMAGNSRDATMSTLGSAASPTFFDNRNPYSSTSSSNRSSAKAPRNRDLSRVAAAVIAAEPDSNSENTDNKYDAVYYTKEPLPRRNPVDFPDKNMDVDINMKSYRTHHGNRPSDL